MIVAINNEINCKGRGKHETALKRCHDKFVIYEVFVHHGKRTERGVVKLEISLATRLPRISALTSGRF